MIDTRFATALQIVISIVVAERQNVRPTSNSLAASLDANPTFIRKVLKTLASGGLVDTAVGYQGGVRLCRPANEIKISEIYRAAVTDKKLWATRDDIPRRCFVTNNIGDLCDMLNDRAERAVMASLGSMSVEEGIVYLRRLEDSRTSGFEQSGR